MKPAPSAAWVPKSPGSAPVPSPLCPVPAPNVDARNGIVFILDISGSMYEPYSGTTRLALARELLAQRIRDLKEGTPFALAVYGVVARTSGPLVPANDATRDAAIRFVAQEYDCGGGTNLPAGLSAVSELHAGALLLVTDGDLNMTPSEILPKTAEILGPAGRSPLLTVVGIGPRPGTNASRLLHDLAEQQGGTYQAEEGGNLTASLLPQNSETATP
jgi:hypothetical protein